MGLIKVAEISIDKLEDRKTVTAILHENGYTVGPGKRKKTETGKQLDYYLKVYVEEGTDKAELYKATRIGEFIGTVGVALFIVLAPIMFIAGIVALIVFGI